MEIELMEPKKRDNSCLEGRLQDEEREIKQRIDNRSTLRKVNDIYFRPKFFEKGGRIYELLGVKYFQKALMGTIGKLLRKFLGDEKAGGYFIGKRASDKSLKTFESWTRIFELIHAPQIPWNIYNLGESLSEGDYNLTASSGACLLINAMCGMLQIYNRVRIYEALERREKRRPN